MVGSPWRTGFARGLYCILYGQLAGVAFAEPSAPASAGDDIVVTGARPKYSNAVSDVRTLATSRDDQLPRFETEVCPLVLGLAPQFADPVARRIGEVTERLGLRAGKAGCSPNLTVIVADHGDDVIAALQKRMPNLFAAMTAPEMARLKRRRGPVWNWYALDPKRRDGGPVEQIRMISFGPTDPPRPVSPGAYIASNASLSRLTMPVRLDLTLSFVVLDSASIYGLTARQIGDSAAMLGLSMIDFGRVGSLHHSSVLQLLQDRGHGGRIRGLTEFDIAYLTGLYSGEPGQSSDRQFASIAARVVRASGPGKAEE